MRKLQRDMERFFYRNRSKGIRNLMLYIAIGNILFYVVDAMDPSHALVLHLAFDRMKILHQGQVWRLVTCIFVPPYGNPLILALMMFLYYRLGSIMEARCGTLKFNLFYLSGVVIIDAAALIFRGYPSVEALHYSFLLAYATLCPEDMMLLFFVIPIKMRYLAIVYLALTALNFLQLDFFPVAALLNYFIFFGADMKNLFPSLGRYHHVLSAEERRRNNPHAAPDPKWSDRYRGRDGQKPYRHKCTVCGRTDTDYPGLEFRYCSRCEGYHCYCIDHINNHVHIQS